MPKEFRKRGKKKKSAHAEEEQPVAEHEPSWNAQDEGAGPSWIVQGDGGGEPTAEVDPAAPFGYVDPDVKAYFRTVDNQLREWQENQHEAEVEEDVDPNENRRMFLLAALQEMGGKERELATDPDCSTVLERMAHSMDDFVRRVFMDSLSGSYEQLSKHRFASHVIQTLLEVLTDTISRESRAIFPKVESQDDKGELRTATQLVLDIAEELLPSLTALVLDPFGSHVLRALFMALCPTLFASEHSALRSKKSAAWKAKQGQFKSVFVSEVDKVDKGKARQATEPAGFSGMAHRVIERMREDMDANEVRSLAANKSSSPVLQMAIRVEADLGMADEPESLMDRVMVGLITQQHNDPSATPEASDYLGTLLRDATASHLLECLIACAPPHTFPLLWRTYFVGSLARLAVHPVANFVVAKALERVDTTQLLAAIDEMAESWKKIRTQRPGVLRALIERAVALKDAEDAICEVIYTVFELKTDEDRALLVPCVLRLQTPKEYHAALAASSQKPDAEADPSHKRYHKSSDADPSEPKVAGALLLQSMLLLTSPRNDLVISSLEALSLPELTTLAQHPMSSRVLDALLTSPTVTPRAKRSLIQRFIGHYQVLVDDRVGSRVGDRLWASADPYLREKVARSLVPHESTLAGSFYGKFFARNLNLYLLRRKPDEWKEMQVKAVAKATPATVVKPAKAEQTAKMQDDRREGAAGKKKRKRGQGEGDEIDALFDGALGRKVKRAALDSGATDTQSDKKARKELAGKEDGSGKEKKRRKLDEETTGGDLAGVLGAIRNAPKGEEKARRKHKAKA
ncbi:ARM repeat-containing protein [Peniophora sp. CONT]|nr:ARM repeat-containing protein [Peniophora sp. CONT]